MSSTPSNSSLASLKNRRRNNQNSGSTATTSSQSGKGGSNFMKMYSEDTPGLKIDPVMVLVISLVFIGSVFILHIWGKFARA